MKATKATNKTTLETTFTVWNICRGLIATACICGAWLLPVYYGSYWLGRLSVRWGCPWFEPVAVIGSVVWFFVCLLMFALIAKPAEWKD